MRANRTRIEKDVPGQSERTIEYHGRQHMIRYGVAFFMVASSALMATGPAYSQVVQYQFSPPPPVLPATPSYSQGFGVAPPVPAPGPSADPYLFPPSPSFVQVPGRAPVIVPPLLSGPGSSNGITNCLQAGAAAGLGANELGGFTNQCLN
jgi:hypothetical protein